MIVTAAYKELSLIFSYLAISACVLSKKNVGTEKITIDAARFLISFRALSVNIVVRLSVNTLL